jgi:hypothetical protein
MTMIRCIDSIYREREQSDSRVGALTFEAMRADCAARGCRLMADPLDSACIVHSRFAPAPGPHHQIMRVFDPDDMAAIDAWRRSLHGGD